VCPALAHRANLGVVAHTATAARTAVAAMCLTVTHGSAVVAEMFPQFVAVVVLPPYLDLLRTAEMIARADNAAGSLIPTADAG
jgi:hypothetical protein